MPLKGTVYQIADGFSFMIHHIISDGLVYRGIDSELLENYVH